MDIQKYIESLPFDPDLKRRIAMTYSCKDCEAIPKIDNAGETFHEKDYRYQLMHNGLRVIEDCYHGKELKLSVSCRDTMNRKKKRLFTKSSNISRLMQSWLNWAATGLITPCGSKKASQQPIIT